MNFMELSYYTNIIYEITLHAENLSQELRQMVPVFLISFSQWLMRIF